MPFAPSPGERAFQALRDVRHEPLWLADADRPPARDLLADRIDAAGNDLPTVLAALEFGLETCSGEAAEILERMYRALTSAAETGGHGIDVAITDGPLADRIGRAGDFTGQSVKGILVVAFGTIDSTRDMDEQFDRGVVRLRELLEVSEAAMPGGSGLSNKIREAFDAGRMAKLLSRNRPATD